MFIDAYSDKWFDDLCARRVELPAQHRLYLLIDGAFVPGLYKQVRLGDIALLFDASPACTAQAKDVSPFLIPFSVDDKHLRALLGQCEGWPMVDLIETPEPVEALAQRLSAWCIVEADGQRFNFRFADTRRLPAIHRALDERQRAQLTGPACRWSYVKREGGWADLALGAGDQVDAAPAAILDERQFAALVDDSRLDELLSLLHDRGHDVYRHPSRSHALLAQAFHGAAGAGLGSSELLGWCECFWLHDQLSDNETVIAALAEWRNVHVEGVPNA